MKRLIAVLLASSSLCVICPNAQAQSTGAFTNGSFEGGDFTGWTVGGGYWYGGTYPVPTDYLPGGTLYDSSGAVTSITSAGFDQNTDNVLRTVYAGNHSGMVNDPLNNYSVSVISQRVNGYTDNAIAFAYAAVLEQSHGPSDSDAFIITLTDNTTNEILYSYNLNSATAPGTFTYSSTGWYYTDWITQSIDVSSRHLHDFTLSLLANDCPYGGHAGYAYLDGFGSVLGGGGTGGQPSIPLLYWDGDATGNAANLKIDGGDGIWTATKGNWTESTGATNGAYTPNPGAVIFSGAPGTVTVDKSQGGISVQGMQFLTSGYKITGDEVGLDGTAVVQVGDGTDAASTFTTEIASSLTGAGGLQKTDLGMLLLTGESSYIGGTEVAAGKMLVHGSIASSAVTVDSGATLGGHGTVGSVTANEGSTVSPGASIGTLTVAGDYSQAGGATLQNELMSTGETDKLAVTGAATISPGAVINVTKLDSSRYVLGTRYQVLSAEDGVTGTYSLTGDTHVSYFIDLVDHYDANHVYLDVAQTKSFASAGITPNQIAAAGGADTKSGSLYTAIAYLPDQASAIGAFDQVSGEVHAAVAGSAMEDSRFIRKAMTDRMTVVNDDGKAVWGTVFNSRASGTSDGNAAAARRDIAGAFFGGDLYQGAKWRAGIVGGLDQGKLHVYDRNSSATFTDFHAGLYAGTVGNGWGAHFGAAYTGRYVKTNRSIAFPGFTDDLSAKYHGDILQAFADVGYRVAFHDTTIEPYVSASYVATNIKGKSENGGSAALAIEKNHLRTTFGTVGLRASQTLWSSNGHSLVLHGMVGNRHASGDILPTASLAFNAGAPFTVDGLPLLRNALLADVGLEGQMGPRTSVDLHYSGLSGKNKGARFYGTNKFRDDGIFLSVRYKLGAMPKMAPAEPVPPPPPPPRAPRPGRRSCPGPRRPSTAGS